MHDKQLTNMLQSMVNIDPNFDKGFFKYTLNLRNLNVPAASPCYARTISSFCHKSVVA